MKDMKLKVTVKISGGVYLNYEVDDFKEVNPTGIIYGSMFELERNFYFSNYGDFIMNIDRRLEEFEESNLYMVNIKKVTISQPMYLQ